MPNPGNFCFLNSLIQLLITSDTFKEITSLTINDFNSYETIKEYIISLKLIMEDNLFDYKNQMRQSDIRELFEELHDKIIKKNKKLKLLMKDSNNSLKIYKNTSKLNNTNESIIYPNDFICLLKKCIILDNSSNISLEYKNIINKKNIYEFTGMNITFLHE
jgi:hypothetical protein